MKKALVVEAPRAAYSIDQIERPMTLGELAGLLEEMLSSGEFEEDDLFILSHDNGYTYGSIDLRNTYETHVENEDGEWIKE